MSRTFDKRSAIEGDLEECFTAVRQGPIDATTRAVVDGTPEHLLQEHYAASHRAIQSSTSL